MPVLSQPNIRGRTSDSIWADVEAAIGAGRLQPGDPLPSVRAVAAANGVSPTTVAAAYRELRRRGRVLGGERRRLTVAPNPDAADPVARAAVPVGAVDLADGGPDPALLPDHRPALAAVAAERRDPGGYDRPAMDPELGAWFRTALAVEHLTVCSGALDAVERALAAWLRPGDAVAVEDPGYPDLLHLVRVLNLEPVPIPVDDRGPEVAALAAALKRGAKAVVVTPRAQNPMGAALDARRAGELGDLLARHPDVLVVEDDHFGLVAGPRLPLDATRWAWAYSVSKGLGPDLRLAAVAGDAETVARIERRFAAGPGWVSHLLQRTVFHLLSAPETPQQLVRAAAAYDERRNGLAAALAARGVVAQGQSGLNAWVPVPDEAAAALALAQAGFHVNAGARFRLASPPGIRITAARLTDPEPVAAAVAPSPAAHRWPRRLGTALGQRRWSSAGSGWFDEPVARFGATDWGAQLDAGAAEGDDHTGAVVASAVGVGQAHAHRGARGQPGLVEPIGAAHVADVVVPVDHEPGGQERNGGVELAAGGVTPRADLGRWREPGVVQIQLAAPGPRRAHGGGGVVADQHIARPVGRGSGHVLGGDGLFRPPALARHPHGHVHTARPTEGDPGQPGPDPAGTAAQMVHVGADRRHPTPARVVAGGQQDVVLVVPVEPEQVAVLCLQQRVQRVQIPLALAPVLPVAEVADLDDHLAAVTRRRPDCVDRGPRVAVYVAQELDTGRLERGDVHPSTMTGGRPRREPGYAGRYLSGQASRSAPLGAWSRRLTIATASSLSYVM